MRPAPLLTLLCLAACDPGVEGFEWTLAVVDAHDDCHVPPVDYEGPLELDYVVQFEGSEATVFYEEDVLASGTIAGCTLRYATVVWDDERDGFAVSWRLVGEATWRTGEAGGCDLPDGIDWQGTETFEIVRSEHPDLEAGCTYGLDLEGTYLGGPE